MVQKRKEKALSTLISLALVMGTCFPTFAFVSAANADEAPDNEVAFVEVSDDTTAPELIDDAADAVIEDSAEDAQSEGDEETGEESALADIPAPVSAISDEPKIQTYTSARTSLEMPTADNRIVANDCFWLLDPNGNEVGFSDSYGGHFSDIAIYKGDEHVADANCFSMAGECSATINLDDYGFKNGDIIRLEHNVITFGLLTAYVYYVGEEASNPDIDKPLLLLTSGRYTLEQIVAGQGSEITFDLDGESATPVLSYKIDGAGFPDSTTGYSPSIFQVTSADDEPQRGDTPSYWYSDPATPSVKLPIEPGEYLFYVVMREHGLCEGSHFGCYKLTVAEEEKTEWTVIIDGVETTIELPEGEKPVEGTDFTVPDRYGHTSVVDIDEDAHTVTITYISNLVDWTIRYVYPDGTESTVNSSVISGTQPELNIRDIEGYTPHTDIDELTSTITVTYTQNMVGWSVVVDGVETDAISVPENDTPEQGVDFTVEERLGYTAVVTIDEQGKVVRITYTKNVIEWTVNTDGVESTIELPEGTVPEQDKDFTVPERDGYTPTVTIDEDARTVTIAYTKDETSEQPLPPVIPIVPGDDDVVLPPATDDGKDDNTGNDDKLVETGKPVVPSDTIDSNKTPEATVNAPAPAPVAGTTTDASDDEVAPQNDSDDATTDDSAVDAPAPSNEDTDTDSAYDAVNYNADIPENDTPLFGEETATDDNSVGLALGVAAGTAGTVTLLGGFLFFIWRRGKWTIKSDNLPDELAWSTKVKCRTDESIEDKLEDFEIPVVPGYVVTQRVIDEDEKEVVFFYVAQ